ncbi:MAG: Lipid A biosynthesis lauroyl acyltransferase [Syntrophorhabdaceae bacterium PtaU1.Bin034]|nr:MAG: Lipid A biosynthesis lauroyl acyltransferase [Syntrophorhabdaceae bacterium PtaU1.Bin034]
MGDFLLISLTKTFQQVLRVLPERFCCLKGVALGRLGYVLLGKRRRVAIENARRISPGISRSEAKATARQCFENLGVNFLESLLFPYIKKEEYSQRFRLETRGNVEGLLKANRGALALGFHYSNWEITGIASFLLGREIIALARPLKGHARLNRFLNSLRGSTGLTIIPNKDTARDVLRLLQENRIVAFLGDQREKRSKGVWVDLFGQKVPTSKGIVMIAMKTGAPVIPIYARRDGFLRYTIVYNEPIDIERKGAPMDELIARNARRINAFLEGIVAENPSEWFLVHRRFGRDT